ncbi:NHL repeat-containing protein [bacterium]|nr:NHL repeat-containing protein [bacterium]
MRLILPTALSLLVLATACARVPPLASPGTSLLVTPSLFAGSRVQAVVAPKTAADIHRLDLILEIQTAPEEFAPISALTGQPTTLSDPNALTKTLTAPIDFNRATLLGNLRPQTTYRVLARAYDAAGNLISTDDERCAATVAVGNNDQSAIAARLPVKLVDTVFAGRASVTINLLGPASASLILTDLTAPRASYPSLTQASASRVVTVSNLRPTTNYQLLATSYDASGQPLSTASATLAVANDDALASMSIDVPAVKSDLVANLKVPMGVAVDRNGFIYVVESALNQIKKYDASGVLQTTFTDPAIVQPRGLAVDAANNLYVTTIGGDNVLVFSPTGTLERTLTGLANPKGVAVDAAGNVYVASSGNSRVFKFLPGATSSTTVVASNTNSGEGVAVDGLGTLYYTATGNGKVYKLVNGLPTLLASGLTGAAGLTVDPFGNVYVAVRGDGRIAKILPGGTVLNSAIGFTTVQVIAQAPNGQLYVSDSGFSGAKDKLIRLQ